VVSVTPFAESSENRESGVRSGEVSKEKTIKVEKVSAALADGEISQAFAKVKGQLRARYCLLTNLGIDMTSMGETSLAFDKPSHDALAFKIGEVFCLPVLYVKEDELLRDSNVTNLRTPLEVDERVLLFYEMISRSNYSFLLDAAGPYTLYALDNGTLERAYGMNTSTLRDGSQTLDKVVLSYFIPGTFARDFSGKVLNVCGDEVEIANGILMIPGRSVKVLEERFEVANGNLMVISASGVLPPSHRHLPELLKSSHVSMSYADIATDSYTLWSCQMDLMSVTKRQIEKDLQICMQKLKIFTQHEAETRRLSVEMDSLDVSTSEEDRKRLTKKNGEFVKYVEEAARVNALRKHFDAATRHLNY
jgi:hypothetical protein